MRVLRWAGRFWTGVLALIVILAVLLLGLRVLLPFFSAAPRLLESTPVNGASGVAPRTQLVLRFDTPMNPRSVEHAVSFEPELAWQPIWSADNSTLTISPSTTLRPDSSYRLTLTTAALSQRFRPLEQPAELRFRTAPAPAVVQVLPADGTADVQLETPISIRFSRSIVLSSALMQPASLPELQFDPPLPGSATWLDAATVLFRPSQPLQPGTRYRATIDATLRDIAGVELNRPFSWSFSTPAPAVLDFAPANGAQLIAPHATLAITLSQPLDRGALRASLVITPTTAGDLSINELPDGRQLLLYAPFAGWKPARSYEVALQAGVLPEKGNLPLARAQRWSFSTAPQPALTGRFPGEGQTLPPGQEIRLIFNTPVDAVAISTTLQLTPTARLLRVDASEAEVRIAVDVRAATAYTLTLPATLTDRNGIPLGQAYRLRFVTAGSGPALELPEAPAHLAQALPDRVASLLLRRTNLSALNFDIYRLDEAAVVRMAGFQEVDWSLFQPERYGQPLLRSWSVPLSDPLNAPVEQRIALTAEGGAPLPAGAYYLRIRTLEGPRADLLLLVSRTRLTLQTLASTAATGSTALVWATDVISGTPLGALPVSLYQSGALVQQGTTGADGLVLFRPASGLQAAIVLVGGERIAVSSSAWGGMPSATPQLYRVFLTTDRAAYHPGERVELAGIVRSSTAVSSTFALPSAQTIGLNVRSLDGDGPIYQQELQISADGLFNGGFTLPANLTAGTYTLAANIGASTIHTSFAVQPDEPAPLLVGVQAPPTLAAGAPARLAVEVRTPEGLPVAGATISWTLTAVRAPFPSAAGYQFGDDEAVPTLPAPRGGLGQADIQGRFSLQISDLITSNVPLRYQLTAQAIEPGGPSALGRAEFLAAPAEVLVGLQLPSRIFTTAQEGVAELLALTPGGQPAPGADLLVEVYRRRWERRDEAGTDGITRTVWLPRDQLAFTRSAVAGDDGRASMPLKLPAGGAYRLRVAPPGAAWAGGAATVWATAPGFDDWGELPGGQPLLIADRDSYRPGEIATLLLVGPPPQAPVLITHGAPGGLAGELRSLRAGVPFTATLQSQDAPALALALLLDSGAAREDAVAAPAPPVLASAILPVQSDQANLAVAIQADAASYAPGATATLTITTSDPTGAGVPADLILRLGDTSTPAPTDMAQALRPPGVALATQGVADRLASEAPRGPEAAPDAPALHLAPSVYWNPTLRTNASGVLTLTLQLPRDPASLRALAWAAAGDRFGQASAPLTIKQSIALAVEAPPVFRAGDTIELAAWVENMSAQAREVQASLLLAGVRLLDNQSVSQRSFIGAGGRMRFVWRALVLDVAGVSLSISAHTGDEPAQLAQIAQPIMPAMPEEQHDSGIALLRDYLDPQTGQPLDLAQLRDGQLLRVRLTIVATEAHRFVSIAEPLPGNAVLISAPASSDFVDIVRASDHLTIASALLPPGIYQYSYVLRVVAGGLYYVPATSGSAADGARGAGNSAQLEVELR